MATEPSTDQEVGQIPEGEPEGTGEGLVENFGVQAVISIVMFIAFVVFAIACLPIYIL